MPVCSPVGTTGLFESSFEDVLALFRAVSLLTSSQTASAYHGAAEIRSQESRQDLGHIQAESLLEIRTDVTVTDYRDESEDDQKDPERENALVETAALGREERDESVGGR